MAIFEQESTNVVFPPKQGETPISIVVKSMRKVEQDEFPERNLKSKDKNFGYYYELALDNGKTMPINVWKLYFAFKESGVDFGENVTIGHPDRGVYTVNASKDKPTKAEKDIWAE